MLINIDTGKLITRIPHKKSFEAWRKQISNEDYQAVVDELNKRIDEHEGYIKNHYTHVPEWDEYSVLRQEGLKKHWRKEIRNFRESINNRIAELKKRGDYNG